MKELNGKAWHQTLTDQLDWLRIVVRSRLGQPHHVDDVLQDVIADALAVNPNEVRMVRPWLYRLAIRKVSLFRRSAGRQRRAYEKLDLTEGRLHETPLELMLGEERRDLVGMALERLAGKDVEILTWKYVEKWSYQTISAHLGITESRVAHRLRMARTRLRSEIELLFDQEELQ